jgi:hypothetical protein
MSLNLEKTENQIATLLNVTHPIPLFYFPITLQKAKREIDKLRPKLDSNLYGPKTKERIKALVSRWDETISELYHLPLHLQINSLDDLLIWTLAKCGARIELKMQGSGVSEYSVFNESSSYSLRILQVTDSLTVCYLDSFELKVDTRKYLDDPLSIPLRFFLSCISPAFHNTAFVYFQSIPSEPLAEAIKFLDIETIGNLSCASRWFNEFCDSGQIWEHIYQNLGHYANVPGRSGDDGVLAEASFKEKVHAKIKENDRRRMLRFSRSIESADWALPMEFLSPTAAVRRRRYNRFDLDNVLL